MLFEPERTQFDLNWRMFGIPVRVHPWFWLMGVILGWSAVERGVQYLVLWIVCVFVSILVHEFGHVFMGLVFGSRGHIVLYSFGGLAVGQGAPVAAPVGGLPDAAARGRQVKDVGVGRVGGHSGDAARTGLAPIQGGWPQGRPGGAA